MNLTSDDLQAIKQIVDTSIDARVPGIVKAEIDARVPGIVHKIVSRELEVAVDEVKQHVAAGFAEVHEKFALLQASIDEVARVQHAEIGRTDAHSKVIKRMRKVLHEA